MLDHFAIFSNTGLVVWSKNFCAIKGDPIDDLIKRVLLEERAGLDYWEHGNYGMKWTLANDVGLIFVAVFQKFLSATYMDDLLSRVRAKFVKMFGKPLAANPTLKVEFDGTFVQLWRKAESAAKSRRGRGAGAGAGGGRRGNNQQDSDATESEDDTEGEEGDSDGGDQDGTETTTDATASPKGASGDDDDDDDGEEEEEGTGSGDATAADGEDGGEDAAAKKTPAKASFVDLFKNKRGGRRAGGRRRVVAGGSGSGSGPRKAGQPSPTPPRSTTKKPRESTKVNSKTIATLDRSKPRPDGSSAGAGAGGEPARRVVDLEPDPDDPFNSFSDDTDSDDDDSESKSSSSGWFGSTRIGGLFASLSGNHVLTEEDLEKPLAALQDQLMKKNVAAEVAEHLCRSVATSMSGHKLERFTTVAGAAKKALRGAIERLLTPKKSTDLLAMVEAKKRTSGGAKPFVLVFIGVNGVGKSTSLAKVTHLLKSNGHNPMIAACDTFRSGAVEQLKVHSRALDVPVFERGQGKDPAMVAAQALKFASSEGHDVVLIDTAGRMQNNAPLMEALARLVFMNTPDLVLFVGEALVGNDGVDQLALFDKSLVDHAPRGRPPRHIDGIVLTKFDTIDDKVGAALSMVYRTGQPIMFVGTGQKYTNLHRLNVDFVVRSLLK